MWQVDDEEALQRRRRRKALHDAVDNVFDSVLRKREALESKRRKQGEILLKIQKRRLQLVERMRTVEREHKQLQEEGRWLRDAMSSKWAAMVPAEPSAPQSVVTLNVGGQVFETASDILEKERGSALEEASHRHQEGHETPFFDRDWWLFRHILQFLREGPDSLPRSKALLKQLFEEARFFRLRSLRSAIRDKYQRLAALEATSRGPLDDPAAVHRLPAGSRAPLQPSVPTTTHAPADEEPAKRAGGLTFRRQGPPFAGMQGSAAPDWASYRPENRAPDGREWI